MTLDTTQSSIPYRPLAIGALTGTIYGVVLRWGADTTIGGFLLAGMSLAFLLVVPGVLGYMTVRPHPSPSITYRLFAPWVTVLLGSGLAALFRLEGAFCMAMALPLMLVIASIGGLIAALDTKNTRARLGAMMLLPLAVGGIERHVPTPFQVRRVESTIDISAPADAVWREIVSVREIGADELPPALYLRMGLPRPISATIDRDGIGAVRQARFDRGLLFLETVDEWELGRRLGFKIAAQTDLIPPTTLDPHVTIGGPYFDVLHGSYWIEQISTGQVRLHLESRLRVSTHLNWYAGRWADAIMSSIQRTILVVEKTRAEAGSR